MHYLSGDVVAASITTVKASDLSLHWVIIIFSSVETGSVVG